jgi:MoxR-like ATPase
VFNGSSAILNSLLAFMNEGRFHDRGAVIDVAVQCVFGATNSIPRTPELKAIFDRFTLRVFVDNADARSVGALLGAAWGETYATQAPRAYPDLLDGVRSLQAAIRQASADGGLTPRTTAPFYTRLGQIVLTARQYGYSEMSNRRLVKMLHIMLVHALYEAVKTGAMADVGLGEAQLGLLRFAVDRRDDFLDDVLAADQPERAG